MPIYDFSLLFSLTYSLSGLLYKTQILKIGMKLTLIFLVIKDKMQ